MIDRPQRHGQTLNMHLEKRGRQFNVECKADSRHSLHHADPAVWRPNNSEAIAHSTLFALVFIAATTGQANHPMAVSLDFGTRRAISPCKLNTMAARGGRVESPRRTPLMGAGTVP